MATDPAVELGVRRTIASYCHHHDATRPDDWGRLFADDGVLHAFGTAHRGRDAIVAALGPKPGRPPAQHVTYNTVVDLDADGTARARSDFMYLQTGDDGPALRTVGSYYDRLVRDGADWRFAERWIAFLGEPAPPGW